MRRIELDIGGKSAYWGNDKCVTMRHKDWLLVRAVVKAADSFWLVWGDKKISSAAVVRLGAAVARFNAKPGSKP